MIRSRKSATHFNPPTPCGVGPRKCSSISWKWSISIHPPRVGWDAGGKRSLGQSVDFNPPTPCGVGRGVSLTVASPCRFQSTHPVWGGTMSIKCTCGLSRFQSTHPVWGGTASVLAVPGFALFQSTHPVWGGTQPGAPMLAPFTDFNPPTPCGVGRRAISVS